MGICSFGHEASAALLKDGKVVIALEEERFNREKHTNKFPENAIKACLEFEKIQISDVSQITFFMKPRLEVVGNLGHVIRFLPHSLKLFGANFGGKSGMTPLERLLKCLNIRSDFKRIFPGKKIPKVAFVEHHLAHAASCFFLSKHQKAAILTLDGRGESCTTLLAKGNGNQIEKIFEFHAPHSLGHLYAAITEFLGFKAFSDEWKVMGMAAYGSPTYLNDLRKIVEVEGWKYRLNLSYFQFHIYGPSKWFSQKFFDLFGPGRHPDSPVLQRHFDFAKSFQCLIEDVGLNLARHLRSVTDEKTLCLAGGVALNILMNSKIIEEAGFESVFIQPVANDAGTSFGSASYYWHQILKRPRDFIFENPYLGLDYSDEKVQEAFKKKGLNPTYNREPWLVAAEAIANSEIVGWFQGRMEIGPRALGNRSILANPCDPKMRDILNSRIKQRESFRPFAPSVLEEDFQKYFWTPRGVPSPYMIVSGRTRPEFVSVFPSVTHVDGTARVHTVQRKMNERYWCLLHALKERTGHGVALNTSFNEREPIVENPEQAIDCFLRTKMDLLVIGNWSVRRADVHL